MLFNYGVKKTTTEMYATPSTSKQSGKHYEENRFPERQWTNNGFTGNNGKTQVRVIHLTTMHVWMLFQCCHQQQNSVGSEQARYEQERV